MAFKMKGSPMHRNFGIGTPMKTGDHSDATGHKHGISKTLKDKTEYDPRVETRGEVEKANTLEDKNNDAAARKEYMEMMKARKASPLKDSGHGLGNHGKHGSTAEAHNVIKRANKGDPRSQQYNAKKLAKKTTKSEEKKSKADAKMAAHDRLVQARSESGKSWKEISGKERRAEKKTGHQAARAAKRSDVAESVRKYEAHKIGDYMEKPKKKTTTKVGEKRGRNRTKNGVAVPKKTRKIFGDRQLKGVAGSKERVKETKEETKTRKSDGKTYRQNKGLRGAVNARRTGKGKDKI